MSADILGYRPQSDEKVADVNRIKQKTTELGDLLVEMRAKYGHIEAQSDKDFQLAMNALIYTEMLAGRAIFSPKTPFENY